MWVVITDETRYFKGTIYEEDTNVVGVFNSREDAVKNAKVAMANMDNCKNVI